MCEGACLCTWMFIHFSAVVVCVCLHRTLCLWPSRCVSLHVCLAHLQSARGHFSWKPGHLCVCVLSVEGRFSPYTVCAYTNIYV